MNKIVCFLLVSTFFLSCNSKKNSVQLSVSYPEISMRLLSDENTTYYIDPNRGNDTDSGTEQNTPWKTFKNVNRLRLTKGNTIKILSSGTFRESLFIVGEGTQESPITIQFASGKYDFYPEEAFKSKFHISNTNDAPEALKAIAFYFLDSKNIHVKGNNTEIVFRGKVIETAINNCENITIEGLRFDYKRPTVSEFQVIEANDRFADVQIHEDSKYKIVDSTLFWVGEGWEHKAQNLWQVFNKQSQRIRRQGFPLETLRFSELKVNTVRIHFDKNPGFSNNLIYQNRNTFRDYAAFFTQKSKNVLWKNVTVNFMHGMGFVSQFSENITFDSLQVKPNKTSGRTCAAWADILHFSSCKGEIIVKNSFLSAANDDAINVHGTHLRITNVLSKQKVKVRFMHKQTFGFDAFHVGDEIEFIRAKTLLPYSKNIISNVVRLNDHDVELSFKENIPQDILKNDVIENISWTPNVTIQNSVITHIPTRGILVTTRGKVLVENNKFDKTHMSGILISDDANSWFESGYVRDVNIRNNEFIDCGSPVINIHPENSETVRGKAVHKNILINNNRFKLNENRLLSAKSTDNIQLNNNNIEVSEKVKIDDLMYLESCTNISINNNKIF